MPVGESVMPVGDAVTVEAEVIRAFRQKFQLRREYGYEYFTGDLYEMQRCISEIAAKSPPSFYSACLPQPVSDSTGPLFDLLWDFLTSSWHPCQDAADVYLHFQRWQRWLTQHSSQQPTDFKAFALYLVEFATAYNQPLNKKVVACFAPLACKSMLDDVGQIAAIRDHIQNKPKDDITLTNYAQDFLTARCFPRPQAFLKKTQTEKAFETYLDSQPATKHLNARGKKRQRNAVLHTVLLKSGVRFQNLSRTKMNTGVYETCTSAYN
jgi:hypothetical protein